VTIQAADGEEGLKRISSGGIDLVLLDIMLPKMDGYQLLPLILKKAVPVIIITARSSLKDRVSGLNMGADDYITKPFEGLELIARVKAVLRRAGKEESIKTYEDIQVFLESRKVLKANEVIELTAKEFDLLEFLLQNKGLALSREKLLEKVWGYDFEGDTRTVDMHIQKLRSKLGSLKIETIYKIGYRLEAFK
jgi:DNA-binding response OmpR family regulator